MPAFTKTHVLRCGSAAANAAQQCGGATVAGKGHALRIAPSYYGQIGGREEKRKSSAPPLRTERFYLFMEMLLGRHVPSHRSLEVRRRRRRGRGRSFMSKKTLEDQRGTPPGARQRRSDRLAPPGGGGVGWGAGERGRTEAAPGIGTGRFANQASAR